MIHRYIIEATDEVKGFEETIEKLDRKWGIEELEPCNDCISRQKVLDEINRIGIKAFETYNDYSQLYDFVDTLPPSTPQLKIGHWIDTGSGQECSRCHEIQYGYDNHRFYCSNCGAKMQEVEE